ncbi:hypothetical protein CLU79DRAFT_840690 [Phycomyces nitens]|nr:hypothetical protein CLU79DRAFT_840690 [Phycomyces nitens]
MSNNITSTSLASSKDNQRNISADGNSLIREDHVMLEPLEKNSDDQQVDILALGRQMNTEQKKVPRFSSKVMAEPNISMAMRNEANQTVSIKKNWPSFLATQETPDQASTKESMENGN